MSRPRKTMIKESELVLKELRSKQRTLKQEKRIQCLLFIKTNKFKTQEEIADYLSVSLKSIDRWLRVYRDQGISALIAPAKRNKPSKIITDTIHKALEQKLHDSEDSLLGYWHAQQWVNEQFNINIKYQWLRAYLIKHFKTKLKSPRKSHIKKDGQAIEAFFKTT